MTQMMQPSEQQQVRILQTYLLHVGLQHVVVFLGLLDLLC